MVMDTGPNRQIMPLLPIYYSLVNRCAEALLALDVITVDVITLDEYLIRAKLQPGKPSQNVYEHIRGALACLGQANKPIIL